MLHFATLPSHDGVAASGGTADLHEFATRCEKQTRVAIA